MTVYLRKKSKQGHVQYCGQDLRKSQILQNPFFEVGLENVLCQGDGKNNHLPCCDQCLCEGDSSAYSRENKHSHLHCCDQELRKAQYLQTSFFLRFMGKVGRYVCPIAPPPVSCCSRFKGSLSPFVQTTPPRAWITSLANA